ncbi:MAG: cobalamin B12-binding domain-containing protein [Rhodospirillales bacterium]|nr:cobalamin B12-binding domain-containing protein [Rhodospirillales bacterium]
MSSKFALIHIGNDEVYGLEYVAAEIAAQGHTFQWFDGETDSVTDDIAAGGFDFACFSPLTTFFPPAVTLARKLKKHMPSIRTVFGGAHITACQEHVNTDGIDIAVAGPVYGTIEQILTAENKAVIKGEPVMPLNMTPHRREYFDSIPRIGQRHRKTIMSHFGCVYACSYCATHNFRHEIGPKKYRQFYLTRRPVDHVIEEARVLLDFDTKEVCLEDDDALEGGEAEAWMNEFVPRWNKEIGLPVYANVTPKTVTKVSDAHLRNFAKMVHFVTMGVQAARPSSLKLFNRQFQKEEQIKEAIDRLSEFGIGVKMELIIGLPVDDPVGDAIDSIKQAQRIGAGSFGAAFPLMLYPGTALHKWCQENNIPMNEECSFEWYAGVGSVKFEDPQVEKQIHNLSKLATFFIKYNIDERWMRALAAADLPEDASEQISKNNYYESLVARQGESAEDSFGKSLTYMNFRF